MPGGTNLFRLYDPTRTGTTAASFRYFGPLLRFDHQRAAPGIPVVDSDRGIYYAALTLSSCVVEVFGDVGLIECDEWHIAMPSVTRDVPMLDLRGSGAMRAGSVAALGKTPDHSLSQAWSRHFYGRPEYRAPEGLLWSNAHNDEESVALYERAEDAITCPTGRMLRLDDPLLRPVLAQIAEANNLILVP